MDYIIKNNGIPFTDIYTYNTDGFNVVFAGKYPHCDNFFVDYSDIVTIWNLFIGINKVKKGY